MLKISDSAERLMEKFKELLPVNIRDTMFQDVSLASTLFEAFAAAVALEINLQLDKEPEIETVSDYHVQRFFEHRDCVLPEDIKQLLIDDGFSIAGVRDYNRAFIKALDRGVRIYLTDETGVDQWAIEVANGYWLDTFDSETEAVEWAIKNNLKYEVIRSL